MVSEMKTEMLSHMTGSIIPFWKMLRDDKYGGYYGLLTYDLRLDKKAVKGCILNSRILWFFSNAYMLLKDVTLLKEAKHAYDFLRSYCLDEDNGGVFWSCNYDGSVADETKHTYNQAFAVYALASYFDASGDESAFILASKLRGIIEKKCRDEEGYLEAFTADFRPTGNDKLSENGVEAYRTMNTLLHVFEAYSEYLRVLKKAVSADPKRGSEIKAVSDDIRFILDIFADKIYNRKLKRQEVFFDRHYRSLIDLHSYGHDIEASWLIDRGLKILNDRNYTDKISSITGKLSKSVYERAYIDNSLLNECEKGVDDTNRIWWVQAEAVLGFANASKRSAAVGKSAEAYRFMKAAEDVWGYIKDKMIDNREGSEWLAQVDKDGIPVPSLPIVEPWKCPYHNGRMCIYMQDY
ncbi:MAG: AGE family epimerase/isomerase [Lachnospiraceae bacterium]|nr:AGE family epimerase/isomerase [Lachnospiraceae bacterium]